MMKTQLSIRELELQFQSPDFVLKTQQQVAKDFYMSGISFDPSFENQEMDYDSIVEHIGEKLTEIMRMGETATLQLLYQIDIPQIDFLELTQDPDFISKMSELILCREAYKVYLRSRY